MNGEIGASQALWGVNNVDNQRINVSTNKEIRLRDDVSSLILTNVGAIKIKTKQCVVVTFDGVNATCFIDGVKNLTSVAVLTDNNEGDSLIGQSRFGENMNGYLKNMRWYDRALTADEILLQAGI